MRYGSEYWRDMRTKSAKSDQAKKIYKVLEDANDDDNDKSKCCVPLVDEVLEEKLSMVVDTYIAYHTTSKKEKSR